MLQARIHQLKSDVVLDVQHAKVQFVKAPSSGRGVFSSKDPKSTPQEKSGVPKLGQTVDKGGLKFQPSRWMEKLTLEKKIKLKKQQHVLQKMKKNVKENPKAKSKGSKSSSMLPGTSHKTISTTAFPEGVPHKVSKGKQKNSKDEIEVEKLDRRFSQQVSQWASSNPERLQEDSEGTACRDIQLGIRSYLEACVFSGDTERSQKFLLSQHKVMSRRKFLNTSTYNIMMKMWAKKVSSTSWTLCFKTEPMWVWL